MAKKQLPTLPEVKLHIEERLKEVREYLATARKYNRKIKVYALEKVERSLMDLQQLMNK